MCKELGKEEQTKSGRWREIKSRAGENEIEYQSMHPLTDKRIKKIDEWVKLWFMYI